MAHYRAYLLDFQGNIQAMRRIECDGDQEARSRANRFVENFPIELWSGSRKVARFDPRTAEKPSA